MTPDPLLVAQLIRHEGLKLLPYLDTVGKITIGVGRNLSDVGISEPEAMILLDHDIAAVVEDLAEFDWFADLDPVRRRALEDLRFNLGPSRFRGFKRMLAAVACEDWPTAEQEIHSSLMARQTGGRAVTLGAMLRTGRA